MASESDASPGREGRLLDTLRVGVEAGLLCALGFGLADGVLAWRGGPALTVVQGLGCLAASVVVYALLYVGGLGALAVVAHPVLRRREARTRLGLLLGLGLAAGLFLEVYWWTRPYVFYGIPATSPERLAAAAGMALGSLALGLLAGRLFAGLPAAVHRAVRAGVALCLLGGGVTLFLHWRTVAGSERGALNERNRDLPNVLLVVVDALRHDVLSPYGNPRVKTPHLQRLAERGVVFEEALVQAPFTWSSFGSILTGKYPRRHGLVAMDPRLRMKLDQNVTLPWHLKHATRRADGVTLRDGDFAGGTFMTGTLSQGSGLMHGFDSYFEAMEGHELVHLDSRWSVFRSGLLVYKVKNKLTQRFDNSLVVNTAIDWLRAHEGRRFVAMVHLYTTHTPYDPEDEFRHDYCDPSYAGPLNAFYAEYRYAIEHGEYAATPEDEEQIRNLYEAGAAQADRDLGLLMEELERQGALEDTLVIFTSDHGEELGEHGLWEHNWMYQTNLRIPLVMSWPGGLPEGVRVRAMVESVDLLPTVCDVMGLEPPSGEGEYARLDGTSLVPLIRGEASGVKEFSYAENGRFVSIRDARWSLIVPAATFTEADGWERAKAGEFGDLRLFDLENDPWEMENVFADEPEQAERLFAQLARWDETMPIARYDVDLSERDLEAEERLQALGYAGGVGAEIDETTEPRDGE